MFHSCQIIEWSVPVPEFVTEFEQNMHAVIIYENEALYGKTMSQMNELLVFVRVIGVTAKLLDAKNLRESEI
ncbi:unnamed protein product, partial [Mesorhabditis belari]|uniref:Uncharacterized protein n=1 Tax=Mesorhabditis belari TaxID=2138241 RepID=A0AAF3EE98_9BILA